MEPILIANEDMERINSKNPDMAGGPLYRSPNGRIWPPENQYPPQTDEIGVVLVIFWGWDGTQGMLTTAMRPGGEQALRVALVEYGRFSLACAKTGESDAGI